MSNFFNLCLNLIQEKDPAQKCLRTKELYAQLNNVAEQLSFEPSLSVQSISDAGRPRRPQLVPPLEVPKRSMATVAGHASLIHALAHIEFNAINKILDPFIQGVLINYKDITSNKKAVDALKGLATSYAGFKGREFFEVALKKFKPTSALSA